MLMTETKSARVLVFSLEKTTISVLKSSKGIRHEAVQKVSQTSLRDFNTLRTRTPKTLAVKEQKSTSWYKQQRKA